MSNLIDKTTDFLHNRRSVQFIEENFKWFLNA